MKDHYCQKDLIILFLIVGILKLTNSIQNLFAFSKTIHSIEFNEQNKRKYITVKIPITKLFGIALCMSHLTNLIK